MEQSEYVDVQSLKLNTTFSISRKTPLMPQFEPSDPLAALNDIKYLQPECRIRILSIKNKYNFPWYEVQAINKEGKSIGKGWINSTALVGQNIRIVDEAKVASKSENIQKFVSTEQAITNVDFSIVKGYDKIYLTFKL